jgi:hypothetical protein
MRLFLIASLVMFVFALVVAAGGTLVTTWPVWVCAGLIAMALENLIGPVR